MKLAQLLLLVICFFRSFLILGQDAEIDKEFHQMLSKLLQHSVNEIHPSEIKNSTIYLDAREIEEYNISHIPNAIHVGYNNFNISNWLHLAKQSSIVVYCSVGYRSEKIAEQFDKNGYTNVKNLYGGIFEWAHQNKPLINQNSATDSIHTYNREWSKWLKTGIKVY